ncbi:ribonuclease H-like domain-containing protein [Tanacetum coccineum]|uniref:Ribonuclease H-like domain-containing protein n=1 Tax=Tanacetum coccineum TaxID=301880 RepID=A0ABQ5IKN2_9ASTR
MGQPVQTGLTGQQGSSGPTGHETILPHAFTTTLQDPASEFDPFGFSVKDFQNHRVLLRCDSTGPFYPVTKPSPIPQVYLTSQYMWHQRLGHPGSEVIRSVISNNSISCNKEKSPVLCHACQLDKHVRLSFKNVMSDEYNALLKNNTWTLVPRPTDENIVRCMWLFRHKFLADGTLSRYKARLVENANTHIEGIDVDETFSPLDVKNAFLHGDLAETVYMHHSPGFQDLAHPDHVCLLQRSLYGLKRAPRAWFQWFAAYITRVGFSHSRCDSSLFIYRQGTDTAYLILYVDDIVLITSSGILLQQIIASLHQEFSMTDLGSLNYFLGISVTRDSIGMFLSQRKYATEILERAHMISCNPSQTLIDTESKLGDDGNPVADPTLYRSLAGSLHAEAEYRGVANAVAETYWLRNLLRELHTLLSSATLVYYDNVSVVYLSSNPVQHQQTKHIEIDIHFVRDLVAGGQVRVLHVPSPYQYADVFSKGLPTALFEEFRSSLSVRCPPA